MASELLPVQYGPVPFEVGQELGFYVYLLRDPRDRQVFYVGKGADNRVYAHVAAAATGDPQVTSAKLARIQDIHAAGHRVEHLFVRTGLATEQDALAVEQSVIDAYRAAGLPLTNLQGGHYSDIYGLATVEASIARLKAPPAPPIPDPLVIFIINRAWRADMTPDEVYLATRGHWKVGPKTRNQAKYALGVAFGIVRGAYLIESWFRSTQAGEADRWGFDGRTADSLGCLLNTSVRHLVPEHAQNPVRCYLDGLSPPSSSSL